MAHILLVDDDPDVIEATKMVLEKEGYQVSEAYSRDEGMKILADGLDPDLMILDVMMQQPDDGIAMAQELRKNGFTKPILMLSSISRVVDMDYDKDEDRLPVNEFVDKPIEPAVLVDKVKKLLV